MGQFALEFEGGDWAATVWLAVALLAVIEAGRYIRHGRRPAFPAGRVALIGTAAVLIGSLTISGRLAGRQISHGWACLILALLLLPWLARAYRKTTRPVRPSVRFLLVGLRIAAALVAVLLVARPLLQWTFEERQRAILGVLVDTSESMTIRDVIRARRDAPEAVSRVAAWQSMLDSSRREMKRLEDRLDVEWMAFDSRVRRIDGPQGKAEGKLTALGRALGESREILIQSGSKVAGMILISDGRDTFAGSDDPLQAGDHLAVAGIPLYCIGVGSELPAGQTRSLQARRLDMPDRITVLNRLTVGAEFLAAGLAGSEVNVRLEYDGRPAGEQTIMPREVRELIRADLSHVPREGGLHQVTVVAAVPDLEGRGSRASLSRYVRVTEDKVQVLYIDRARYERAAVARALEHAKELNVTKIDLNLPADAQPPDLLPASPQAWRLYHVVLIGDVPRAHLPDAAMQNIAQLVTSLGRGAAMLGGARTLGTGQYADSPFQDLFPADLAALGQLEGAVKFELTPAGRVHPCCVLADVSSEEIWKSLPPFAGASRLGQVDPTAETLLRAVSGEPLLVVQEKGAGRTAALAFDSSWQWPLASIDTRPDGTSQEARGLDPRGGGPGDLGVGLEAHRRFWRQLVLWLANRKPEVWALPDRPQYDLDGLRAGDEQVIVRAGINDPTSGGLPAGSSVTGEITRPDGVRSALSFAPVANGFEAKCPADRAGEYRVRVEGKVAGRPAGKAETAFVVESVDREMAEPFADLETLKRLAARTAPIGGSYVPMDEFGALLERIRAGGAETRLTRVRRHYLVDDHPWFWLAVFVGLLALEWAIRRKVGLV